MRNYHEEMCGLVTSSCSQVKGRMSLALAEKLIGSETVES